MSAVIREPAHAATPTAQAALVLLGTGVVGGAFLKLLDTPAAARLRLVGVANSTRQATDPGILHDRRLRERLRRDGVGRDDRALLDALDQTDACAVIVDATASTEIAARHADWLRAGYHVVTANKAAIGSTMAEWNALHDARRAGAADYGDAATVGAGLPAIAVARRLLACGDRVNLIEGVFSGALSWLFNHYDGRRPFSELLAEARALGYTEPDPRMDLSGGDVARKLLILARSAGYTLDATDIAIDNLVPDELRELSLDGFLERASELDARIACLHADALAQGGVLRHVARFAPDGGAEVGVRIVGPRHAAAHLQGTDNVFSFNSQRYAAQPLVIRGPGAGAEVTAQALLGDLIELVERSRAPGARRA